MIGRVIKGIPKNYKIWLRPKAPKPGNLERSPSAKEKEEKLPNPEDPKTNQSPSTVDKEDNF
jgi:hypothetical protein